MESTTKHGQKERKYVSRRPSAVRGAVNRKNEKSGKSEASPVQTIDDQGVANRIEVDWDTETHRRLSTLLLD
jgi:hypothetical protein